MSGIDPFDNLGHEEVPEEPTEAVPEVLRHRPSQAQRNRGWEREQRDSGKVVTYRGIPAHLHEEVKRIARKKNVPIGEVVRAFLEYALVGYEQGELELNPQFGPGKLTLYPES
jgi:hypothetical protein